MYKDEHTVAKRNFLFKKLDWINSFLPQKFKLIVGKDSMKIEFLDKKLDFASVW